MAQGQDHNLLGAQTTALAMARHELGAAGQAHGADGLGGREIQTAQGRRDSFHVEGLLRAA